VNRGILLKRTKIDASVFLLLIILILIAGSAVFGMYVLRSDPIGEAMSTDQVINTLFVFEKEGKPLGSYVFMYYSATKRAAVFDIPGDLGLIIRQIDRVDRIDSIYDRGKIASFRDEIEGLLGIDINFFQIISVADLGRFVDLVEGVDILIPSPVEIYGGDSPVFFPSGKIRLDGDKAVLYVSYEAADEEKEQGNFRRQRFFLSLMKRMGEVHESLHKPQLFSLFQSFFFTDMNQRTLRRFCDEIAPVDMDRTNVQSVGGNVRDVSGQTLLFPYYDGSLIKEIVRQTLGALTRQAEGALGERVFTVEVLNGTGINGLAGRTAELLRGFGYDVISIGNAERQDYERTEIIDRSGYEDVAKAMAGIIRCTNIRSESPLPDPLEMEMNMQNYEYRSDFTLIIGRDFNGRYVGG
jgi:anionic cell wall polymer biosynthesis LytR-Cps2A-Psr (LCP) family protein